MWQWDLPMSVVLMKPSWAKLSLGKNSQRFVESFPLDRGGEVDEGVMGTDNVIESCLEELNGARLVLGGFSRFHFESNLQPF